MSFESAGAFFQYSSGHPYRRKICSQRHMQIDNKNVKKIKLYELFDRQSMNENEFNSLLEQYLHDSQNIFALLHKLQEEKKALDDNSLSAILKKLRNLPDIFSGENIYQLVKLSKGIRNSSLKNEIWNIILSKVSAMLGKRIISG